MKDGKAAQPNLAAAVRERALVDTAVAGLPASDYIWGACLLVLHDVVPRALQPLRLNPCRTVSIRAAFCLKNSDFHFLTAPGHKPRPFQPVESAARRAAMNVHSGAEDMLFHQLHIQAPAFKPENLTFLKRLIYCS